MINFPYGMADFRKIITQGYFYVDRTGAIPLLERGESQLFIRPRRFGKSLLLSMLENYYDVVRKAGFGELFGRLTIGRNPTPLRNRYFILRLDFSCVDPTGTPDDMKRSLYNHINVQIENFILYYEDNGFDLSRARVYPEDALSTIGSLLGATRSAGHPVYLLIDEYDNFANTIMMRSAGDSHARYDALVHDEGLLRTVFKVVKASTSATGFDRVFITGVSPVVMSDITSGHNIARDIFLDSRFADLCGFREKEVEDALHEIARDRGIAREKVHEALLMMRTWYNGYRFVPEQAEPVYNPTRCLYFFDEFQYRSACPPDMLDANLAVDESKLRYTGDLPGGREILFSLARRDSSVVIPGISKRFGLRDMLLDQSKDRTFIASFLYYFGVLTQAEETDRGELSLKVPNLVIQGLYVDRVRLMMLPDPVIRDEGRRAAEKVYQDGDVAPVCAFMVDRLFTVFKNRDYAQANELTVKTAFLALLYNDILYMMDSEPELERRYADLTMIIRPDKRYLHIFDVLIEFKFLSLNELGRSGEALRSMGFDDLYALPPVVRALEEGRNQVEDYGKRLARKYRDLKLKTFVVLSLGFERICHLSVEPFEERTG